MKNNFLTDCLFLLIVFLSLALSVSAERAFNLVSSSGLPNVGSTPALRAADINDDGFDDLVLSGQISGITNSAGIYVSLGDGTFSNLNVTLLEVDFADAAWGDMDNDNDFDLAIAGEYGSGQHGGEIYRNNGDGTFTDINAGLINASRSALAWGDPEGDGYLDLMLSGAYFSINDFFDYYHNNEGTNGFTRRTSTGPIELSNGAMACADVNKDGIDDLINTGDAGSVYYTALFYYGTGNTNLPFTGGPNVFQHVRYSSVDWADFNGDTYPDLLLTGATNQFAHGCALIYQNQGGTNFVLHPSVLPGIAFGAGRWGDYDRDGDPDILVTGMTATNSSFVTEVYRNDGGTFVALGAGLESMKFSEATWADVNGDLYPDIVLAGQINGGGNASRVYLNVAGAIVDSDHDGLSDDVETNTGTYNGPNDTGTDPNNADSDNDGTPDGIEVMMGMNPNNPAELFSPTSCASGSEGKPVIEWNSVTDFVYQIKSGPLTGSNTWTNVYSASGTGAPMSYTARTSQASGFYQLTAEQP